jgi:hypothetical protein
MSNIIVGGYPSGGFYTQDDIRGYKVYTALLTQTGATAPTARVLENTLGVDVIFGYIGVGIYEINFSGNIITSGTNPPQVTNWAMIQSCSTDSPQLTSGLVIWAYYAAPNQIVFETYDAGGNIGDEFIQDVLIEIRIYP